MAVPSGDTLSATTTSSTTAALAFNTSKGAQVAQAIPRDELSTTAKVGIGVGVGVGVLLLIGLLLWAFIDPLARLRHRRLADRIEAASRAQGRGPSPPPSTFSSTLHPSSKEIELGSPITSSLSNPNSGSHLRKVSPLSPSEVLDLSSDGLNRECSVEARNMAELHYHEDSAPAPIIGGIGIRRNASMQSRYGTSSSMSNTSKGRNKHSAQAWVAPNLQQRVSHTRSGSVQSLHAMGPNRRPSTSQSDQSARTRRAFGRWAVYSDNGAGRSDSIDLQGLGESVHPTGRSDLSGDQGRNGSLSSQAGTEGQVARCGSQRSARIVTSPIEMAGERYEIALEV